MLSERNKYTVIGRSGTMNECLVFVHVESAVSPVDAERQVTDYMQEKLDCVVFAGHLDALTSPAPEMLLSDGRMKKPETKPSTSQR